VLIGRNGQYLKDSLAAIDGCVINAAITGGMPPMLRPFVGRLAGMKTQLAQRKVRRHLEPTYRTRLEAFKNTQHDLHHVEPQDHLQLMLRYAQRERPEELYNLDVISRRLTAANFGSMHQTSIQVTNMLLNILGSDAEYNTIEVLRDEATRIMGKDKEWTKAKICKMNKADSVARETMRCHSFGTRSILRKVMVHGLVTDTGIELPKGSMISFLAQPAQMDVETYEEPHKYDPFRFSRMRDAATNSAKANTLSFVSTGSNYLPFGHGKHACPGRFLLDFELKMIIAYVLRNYDIKFPEEYNGKRSANKWLGEANIPPEGVNLLVKRRMGSI
jgi:cytochrome P450